MRLLDIDLEGLPSIFDVSVYPPVSDDAPVIVSVILASHERRHVERWAKRLGVQATEHPVEHAPRLRRAEAVREQRGVRLVIWTYFHLPEPLAHTT